MKIGVLGLGSIGLRHARNLRLLGHEVIGYDTDEKRMKEFQGKVYSRQAAIEADAVVIATPTTEHYSDWDAVPYPTPIFIEKPLGDASSHALFQDYSDPFGLIFSYLFVGYNLRFHPCVKAAHAWLSNGNIGKVIWAQFTVAQFNDKPAYLRDGVILNWSHEIDLALYLLGPAKVTSASVRLTDGCDDVANFVMEHETGACSIIHLDYITPNEIREGWIAGSEKNIGMDMLGRRSSMGKIIQEFKGSWDDDYLEEMAAFVKFAEAKLSDKPAPTIQVAPCWATGADGLAVLEICRQVKQKAGIA